MYCRRDTRLSVVRDRAHTYARTDEHVLVSHAHTHARASVKAQRECMHPRASWTDASREERVGSIRSESESEAVECLARNVRARHTHAPVSTRTHSL
eukprot:5105263-Pleurochrysis_carterae.AAC.2